MDQQQVHFGLVPSQETPNRQNIQNAFPPQHVTFHGYGHSNNGQTPNVHCVAADCIQVLRPVPVPSLTNHAQATAAFSPPAQLLASAAHDQPMHIVQGTSEAFMTQHDYYDNIANQNTAMNSSSLVSQPDYLGQVAAAATLQQPSPFVSTATVPVHPPDQSDGMSSFLPDPRPVHLSTTGVLLQGPSSFGSAGAEQNIFVGRSDRVPSQSARCNQTVRAKIAALSCGAHATGIVPVTSSQQEQQPANALGLSYVSSTCPRNQNPVFTQQQSPHYRPIITQLEPPQTSYLLLQFRAAEAGPSYASRADSSLYAIEDVPASGSITQALPAPVSHPHAPVAYGDQKNRAAFQAIVLQSPKLDSLQNFAAHLPSAAQVDAFSSDRNTTQMMSKLLGESVSKNSNNAANTGAVVAVPSGAGGSEADTGVSQQAKQESSNTEPGINSAMVGALLDLHSSDAGEYDRTMRLVHTLVAMQKYVADEFDYVLPLRPAGASAAFCVPKREHVKQLPEHHPVDQATSPTMPAATVIAPSIPTDLPAVSASLLGVPILDDVDLEHLSKDEKGDKAQCTVCKKWLSHATLRGHIIDHCFIISGTGMRAKTAARTNFKLVTCLMTEHCHLKHAWGKDFITDLALKAASYLTEARLRSPSPDRTAGTSTYDGFPRATRTAQLFKRRLPFKDMLSDQISSVQQPKIRRKTRISDDISPVKLHWQEKSSESDEEFPVHQPSKIRREKTATMSDEMFSAQVMKLHKQGKSTKIQKLLKEKVTERSGDLAAALPGRLHSQGKSGIIGENCSPSHSSKCSNEQQLIDAVLCDEWSLAQPKETRRRRITKRLRIPSSSSEDDELVSIKLDSVDFKVAERMRHKSLDKKVDCVVPTSVASDTNKPLPEAQFIQELENSVAEGISSKEATHENVQTRKAYTPTSSTKDVFDTTLTVSNTTVIPPMQQEINAVISKDAEGCQFTADNSPDFGAALALSSVKVKQESLFKS